jgi:hypothetical protein
VSQLVTVKTEIGRDRFGRPLVVPPEGGKPVPYTRATTLAGTLDDLYGLMGWKQRQTALGLADRKDLQLAVTAHRDDKRELNRICEKALEAAASSAAATTGTALHSLTELVDAGQDLPVLPDDAAADLEAYRQAMAPFEIVAMEQFTVLDDLKVGGTPDRILKWQDRYFIGDLKTGKSLKFSLGKIAMQLALYSRAQVYDIATGERSPLPPVDQNNALVIHVPAGTGRAEVVWVNIAKGWEAVDLALKVRAWRKADGLSAPFVDPAAA